MPDMSDARLTPLIEADVSDRVPGAGLSVDILNFTPQG